MTVKKIFITLITIVACVLIGAVVLNTLLPNVTTTLIAATEDMVYKATKLYFDFDKDGKAGGDTRKNYTGDEAETGANAGVAGFGGTHS